METCLLIFYFFLKKSIKLNGSKVIIYLKNYYDNSYSNIRRYKKKLLTLINQLERKWKKGITYEEAIKYLLKNRKIVVDKESFMKNIEKFEGILEEGEGKELLKQLRKEERERETQLQKQINSE